jgi:hypothetical protein
MKENINININAHLRRVITQFSESKIKHHILSAHKNYIFHPIKILNLAPGSYFCREGGSTIIPSNHKQIYCKFNQNQQDKPNRTNGYQNHLKTTMSLHKMRENKYLQIQKEAEICGNEHHEQGHHAHQSDQ